MTSISFSIRHGFLVPLPELRILLGSLGSSVEMWWIPPEPECFLPDERIVVCHRLEGEGSLRGELRFAAPLMRVGGRTPLVCLQPETIEPILEGLYFEGDRPVGDLLEDWTTFWLKLAENLRLRRVKAYGHVRRRSLRA